MKILHINSHYQRIGGTEVYLSDLLDSLDELGVENAVVFQHGERLPDRTRPAYQVPGLTDFTLHPPSHARRQLEKILEEERPDLVHLHNVGNVEVTKVCRARVPTIRSIHTHSVYCPGGNKYLPAVKSVCTKPFGPLCVPYGLLTHCISRRPNILLGSYIRSLRGLAEDKRLPIVLVASRYVRSCVVQNGYPDTAVRVLPYFTNLPTDPGASPNSNTVLFVGRVVPQKGLDVLLRSLKYVRSSFRLIVDGAGPDLERATELARQMKLQEQVEFVGWAPRDEHLLHYRQASVVVVPSTWPEPFGMVGIEAMSYGKPVVAFNVGGIPDWLNDGATGFLVTPRDVAGLGKKIDYLLQHPDVAHQMGMRGRRRVEEDFSKEKHMARLLEVYQEVADARGDPSGGRA